ncbi:MAG: S8 family serine peptidase, partial [Gaiellales bacterium]
MSGPRRRSSRSERSCALHDGGVALRRDHVYARTFNGFSAVLSPEAIAALEASPLVAGLYPVRIVYPASVSADALTRAPSTGGLGSLDPLRVAGLDGSGVTVALLDTGVDLTHPALAGRIDPGHDLIGKRSDARAARNPDNRSEIEQHGTQMAALLVGASAAGAPLGLVPGASVLPLRVLGWQEADDGTSRV